MLAQVKQKSSCGLHAGSQVSSKVSIVPGAQTPIYDEIDGRRSATQVERYD